MVFSDKAPKYTYVVTTRYSKEERASLEIGDTLYPYDHGVEVLIPDIKSVVVIKTSLNPDFLGKLLSGYHLSAVEYVTYVLDCIGYHTDFLNEIAELAARYVESGLCYSKIRTPRSGGLRRELLETIRMSLSKYMVEECPSVLSVEVFGRTLCIGSVIYQRHRCTASSRGTSSPIEI